MMGGMGGGMMGGGMGGGYGMGGMGGGYGMGGMGGGYGWAATGMGGMGMGGYGAMGMGGYGMGMARLPTDGLHAANPTPGDGPATMLPSGTSRRQPRQPDQRHGLNRQLSGHPGRLRQPGRAFRT